MNLPSETSLVSVFAKEPAEITQQVATIASKDMRSPGTATTYPTITNSTVSDQLGALARGSSLVRAFIAETPAYTLRARVTAENHIEVTTADGWNVAITGQHQEWFITSPEGRKTRIWGDPHVSESDGDTWDFHENAEFRFGNNSVLVDVVRAENGAAYSKQLAIRNAKDVFRVTDLDTNAPRFVDWELEVFNEDAARDNRIVYELSKDKSGNDQWIQTES